MWNLGCANQSAATQIAAIKAVKYRSRAHRYLLRMPAWRVGVGLLKLVAIAMCASAVDPAPRRVPGLM